MKIHTGSAKVLSTTARSNISSLLPIIVLALFGCLYYASYYNYSFNWADEGSVALISERLAKGERPYIDVEPGYGLLWFYPIAVLFKIFGASLLVLRIWFISVGFAACLISYALLLRLTHKPLVAFLVAALVLLFPGSGYRTYIPLLVIAGAYVLCLYDARTLRPTVPAWLALTANGVYLGITFLIRGDIATVYSGIFILIHALAALQAAVRERNALKLLQFSTRLVGVAIVAVGVGLPFATQAWSNGYLDAFLQQYSYFAKAVIPIIQARFVDLSSVSVGRVADSAGTLLPRASLRSIFWPGHTQWALLTYAPLMVLIFVGAHIWLDLFRQRSEQPAAVSTRGCNMHLIALSLGAFSAFPQFFVFRPDITHLSEFIPGFIVLCGYLLFMMGKSVGKSAVSIHVSQVAFYMLSLLCVVYLGAYAALYPDGFNLRRDRTTKLLIEDRLDVYVNPWEYQVLNELNTIIRKESRPSDYVLCFPYCPGINFAADRPTLQRVLYVDDALLVTQPNWIKEMETEIKEKKPRVIVIWNWDINATPISRFSVWAAPLYHFISETYELRARIARNDKDQSWYEVYVLK